MNFISKFTESLRNFVSSVKNQFIRLVTRAEVVVNENQATGIEQLQADVMDSVSALAEVASSIQNFLSQAITIVMHCLQVQYTTTTKLLSEPIALVLWATAIIIFLVGVIDPLRLLLVSLPLAVILIGSAVFGIIKAILTALCMIQVPLGLLEFYVLFIAPNIQAAQEDSDIQIENIRYFDFE